MTKRTRARDLKKYQVYPLEFVLPIIGSGCNAFNLALEAWAAAIYKASADNERRFTALQWEVLAGLIQRMEEIPAGAIDPGLALADSLRVHQERTGLPGRDLGGPKAVETLADILEGLTSTHAWALMYSVRHFNLVGWKYDTKLASWWTTAWREETQLKE